MTMRLFEAIGPPGIIVAGLIIVAACAALVSERDRAAGLWSEPPVACDGKPDWCLVARSEVVGHDPSYVYVDGELKTLVLPGKTVRIRMTGDTSHLVNFCAYSKQWNCSTPTSMNFASADATLVIYPLTAGSPSEDQAGQ